MPGSVRPNVRQHTNRRNFSQVPFKFDTVKKLGICVIPLNWTDVIGWGRPNLFLLTPSLFFILSINSDCCLWGRRSSNGACQKQSRIWNSGQAVERKLIESNAKCKHLKKLTCKGTLQQVFICLRPRTPYPPSISVYTIVYLLTGKWGELNEREF